MTGSWYIIEGAGIYAYDRYQKHDDVVLVKGIDGKPNVVYMRRGKNVLWGPSADLHENSGVSYWQYLEKNRRIQVYENIGVANYGSYKFIMSEDSQSAWSAFKKMMEKKYPDSATYMRYEYLLTKKAKINEAKSELKQEEFMFNAKD